MARRDRLPPAPAAPPRFRAPPACRLERRPAGRAVDSATRPVARACSSASGARQVARSAPTPRRASAPPRDQRGRARRAASAAVTSRPRRRRDRAGEARRDDSRRNSTTQRVASSASNVERSPARARRTAAASCAASSAARVARSARPPESSACSRERRRVRGQTGPCPSRSNRALPSVEAQLRKRRGRPSLDVGDVGGVVLLRAPRGRSASCTSRVRRCASRTLRDHSSAARGGAFHSSLPSTASGAPGDAASPRDRTRPTSAGARWRHAERACLGRRGRTSATRPGPPRPLRDGVELVLGVERPRGVAPRVCRGVATPRRPRRGRRRARPWSSAYASPAQIAGVVDAGRRAPARARRRR